MEYQTLHEGTARKGQKRNWTFQWNGWEGAETGPDFPREWLGRGTEGLFSQGTRLAGGGQKRDWTPSQYGKSLGRGKKETGLSERIAGKWKGPKKGWIKVISVKGENKAKRANVASLKCVEDA